MHCPKCGGDTTVFSSRKKDDGKVMRRRRQCLECFTRFTTESESPKSNKKKSLGKQNQKTTIGKEAQI